MHVIRKNHNLRDIPAEKEIIWDEEWLVKKKRRRTEN